MVYGMSIGWPKTVTDPNNLKPRLPEELIIHYEKYDQSDPQPLIQQYNVDLGDFYNQQSRNQHQDAWSGPIARRLHEPKRPELRTTLENLGFKFE